MKVDPDDLEQLKEIARQKAVKEKQSVTYGDLIRQLIKKFLGKNK